jgi:prepilin-type N-terminal cleavage/methylation domain-containing protein
MISNKAIEQFKQLDVQTIEGIADEKLRQQALKLKNKQGGFTLLELLVVVGILAIVAGVMLGAVGGQEKRAASGAASNSIAAIESLVRGYRTQGTRLNDLDALVAQDCSACTATATPVLDTTATLLPSTLLGSKLASDKLLVQTVPQSMVDTLQNAGITKVRVLDSNSVGENAGGAATCGVSRESTLAFPCNTNMSAIDIPGRMFDPPASATGNRGRGFSATLPATGGAALPVWKRGKTTEGSPDNRKLGAGPSDVLVALGFGNNIVVGANSQPQINSAPAYGGMLSNQYNRYLLLYNVGTAATNITADVAATPQVETNFPDASIGAPIAEGVAKFVAVVDTRGDFLDEEIAEGSGQKQ